MDGHFAWEYIMHTTENVGQRFNAGSTQQKLGTENTNPILEDAGNECYKINTLCYTTNMVARNETTPWNYEAVPHTGRQLEIQMTACTVALQHGAELGRQADA